jgi:hypothetical protein
MCIILIITKADIRSQLASVESLDRYPETVEQYCRYEVREQDVESNPCNEDNALYILEFAYQRH